MQVDSSKSECKKKYILKSKCLRSLRIFLKNEHKSDLVLDDYIL